MFQENIPHVFIQEGEKGGGIKESGTELQIPVTISISDSQRRKCDDCFILFSEFSTISRFSKIRFSLDLLHTRTVLRVLPVFKAIIF